MITNYAPVGELEGLKYQDISGKNHPGADSLVDRANRNNNDPGYYLIGSKSTVVSVPTPDNGMYACVVVDLKFRKLDDDVDPSYVYDFGACADATPENCSGMTANALIRMAETRATSRAIQLAFNIAEASAEELAEGHGTVTTGRGGGNRSSNTSSTTSSGSTGSTGGGSANGDDLGGWNGNIWYGDNKGKHYTDPSVPVKALQWGADKTNNDKQRQALLNEIGRREGGGSTATTTGNANAGNNSGWKPQPKDIADLVKLGQAAGMNFPAIKELAKENFDGKNDPAKLNKDEFNMLRVMLGGEELA